MEEPVNERVCEQLIARLDPPLPAEQADTLRRFTAFMDHHDAWLAGHTRDGGTLRVRFADEAHRYQLTLGEMADWLVRLDQGEAFPWRDLAMPEGLPPPAAGEES